MGSGTARYFLVLVSVLLAARCLSEDLRGPTLSPETNTTLLEEYRRGTNHSFNCSVASSVSPITNFSMEIPENAVNSTNVVLSVGNTSSHVAITHATPLINGRYTCTATNEFGTSYLVYWVFVGGPPDGASALANVTSENFIINISVNFTDNSSVPVTHVWFTIPHISDSTYSHNITDPLMGEVITLPTISINANDSGDGEYTLQVYAGNDIGSVGVLNQSFHIHNHHESLLIILILAGVLVIAVITVIIAGSIASLYCIRKTRRNNELLGDEDAFDNEEEEALQELIPKHSH